MIAEEERRLKRLGGAEASQDALPRLRRQAETFPKPKILRAAEYVARLAETEALKEDLRHLQ